MYGILLYRITASFIFLFTVHPVSINNFKEKVECILTAAFAHDLEELEKEINSLTEYDDGVKQIVGNIRKRSTNRYIYK